MFAVGGSGLLYEVLWGDLCSWGEGGRSGGRSKGKSEENPEEKSKGIQNGPVGREVIPL